MHQEHKIFKIWHSSRVEFVIMRGIAVFVCKFLNPRRCRGVGATPHEFFWNGHRTAWRISLKFFLAYGASFSQLLAKKILTRLGQVTKLWRHKRKNLRLTFQGNRAFLHGTYCHWLEWGHYAWFRYAHNQMWPLALHNDLPRVIQGHWRWLTPYIPMVANLAVFGV